MNKQKRPSGAELRAITLELFEHNDRVIEAAMELLEAVPATDVLFRQAQAIVERSNALRARLFLVMGEARVRP